MVNPLRITVDKQHFVTGSVTGTATLDNWPAGDTKADTVRIVIWDQNGRHVSDKYFAKPSPTTNTIKWCFTESEMSPYSSYYVPNPFVAQAEHDKIAPANVSFTYQA